MKEKKMKVVSVVLAALLLLCLSSLAWADVFNMGPGLTNLETVAVGDPGNIGELSAGLECGSVGYTYNIGKYEVTTAQYTDFLNHKAKSDPYGLYNTSMDTAVDLYGCNIKRSGSDGNYSYSVASNWANRPVNYVSFWDSLRFANWLNNGQADGDTETGAYTLNSYNGDDGHTIQRNVGAKWFLASEDEWYKADYYKRGGTNAGYWDYATQSDSTMSNDLVDTDPGNNGNFWQDGYAVGGPYWRTNVGEFENSESAYGTFDQGGNVWEWNEAWRREVYAYRGLRGGAFYYSHGDDNDLRAPCPNQYAPAGEYLSIGFRVATVPEPSSFLVLSAAGLGLLLGWRRRSGS